MNGSCRHTFVVYRHSGIHRGTNTIVITMMPQTHLVTLITTIGTTMMQQVTTSHHQVSRPPCKPSSATDWKTRQPIKRILHCTRITIFWGFWETLTNLRFIFGQALANYVLVVFMAKWKSEIGWILSKSLENMNADIPLFQRIRRLKWLIYSTYLKKT